jgi:PKD repeat protein
MKALKKINGLVVAVLVTAVMLSSFPTLNAEETDTQVSIEPASQTVDAGETFTVDISCIPGRPIKAYEFKVSFDASLLKANSVLQGDIFDGYTPFFNAGTINNNAGSIVNVYGLIVGAGNVSASGTFVTISFTAKTISGASQLHLYSVGVCDENGYLSTVITDGVVTVVGTNTPPPSGPPGLPPEIPGNDTEENNQPASPLALSGPTYVEMGVEYGYTVSTTDPDGDQIRYRFYWGDGILSEWSELADSGVTASLYHSWMAVDTYQVYAIAQDEHGLNGSWSALLNVTVSGVDDGSEPPVVDIIGVSGNFSANQTMVFDASGTLDGVIVSYFWDFGDGTNGVGVNPTHVYTQPGKYTVILTVTDNKGDTYYKSIDVNILSANAEASEQKLQDKGFIPAISFMSFIILITFALAIFLVVFFRKHIKSLVFNNGIYQVRRLKLSYAKYKMKRIVEKKAKLGVKMDKLHAALNDRTVIGQVPSRPAGIYYSKIQENYLKTYGSVDFEDESAPEMTSSIDKVSIGERIDKLVQMELAQDVTTKKDARLSIEDIERAVDNLFVRKK